eukprot:767349-Hanusia_phi.AAC.4
MMPLVSHWNLSYLEAQVSEETRGRAGASRKQGGGNGRHQVRGDGIGEKESNTCRVHQWSIACQLLRGQGKRKQKGEGEGEMNEDKKKQDKEETGRQHLMDQRFEETSRCLPAEI